jgi:hypothetical protein
MKQQDTLIFFDLSKEIPSPRFHIPQLIASQGKGFPRKKGLQKLSRHIPSHRAEILEMRIKIEKQ